MIQQNDVATAAVVENDISVRRVLRSPALLTRECLAGVITALALIPEVISFSVIAGVDPKVSLFASVVLCLTLSILGGRPAMVTAAAGSVALVIGPMVHVHGVAYILPAVVMAGLIQILFGVTGMSRAMRYIPRSVMIGFVNALGVLIFFAQVPHVWGQSPLVWALFAVTLAIVLLLPRVLKSVPSPLVAIVVVTGVALLMGYRVPDVGDEGPMSAGLPDFTTLAVPLDLHTLQIIWPTALSIAFVGLMESLLTAKLVDDLTDTPSSKRRESWGLGIGNILAGFYGGIAGCAMIGQTIVNVELGKARSRVSTVAAGLVLLLLVTGLSHVMAKIPMVVLAGIMMVVAVKTVNWHSLQPATLKRMPWSETLVMVLTVGITVLTGNLALGVLAGVIVAMLLFARRVAHVIHAERQLSEDGQSVRYFVRGPLFFASSNDLFEHFDYAHDPQSVTIDLTHAQIWDASTVAALDGIEYRYQRYGTQVTIEGLDMRSSDFHRRLTGNLG
ncbi:MULTISPECIES: SulP family inorganic anion transporter [Pantoea]|uniref:SulP family inorganic anion transporter n=1 Tax=Pantoea allii TaxID=574096 RepID=A0ABS6VCN6_9GAMM|nr:MULTISPECIES: SulP family inorganic anion transporter [Pantoea]MBW1213679.1 SulP family inorganic anion transporter [Pantoea allii]MBW1251930.1 SulP family inorganic anion transporter [Pantoea allii]MBW1257078.1 SulP family inorganic anion transporter [Pantoea allii]MBW1260527.1 SulP family inorganic anion transporter [Pantoea allii]MBW1266155.1 SulP family inorganic anion transporter [Pantoea allii]